MSGIDHSQGEPIVSDALPGRAVLDAVGRAVIVTRPDGEIVLWNQGRKRHGDDWLKVLELVTERSRHA